MAKAKRRVRDTWREKVWYTIKAPVEFDDKEIGETPARDPEFLIGRSVDVTMRELTGDFSKQYIKLNFEIDNVAGKVANTKFAGHKITSDRIRSMIRRGTSRIDSIVIAKTKDDHDIKVHVLAVTNKRAKSSQQKFMRETIQNLVTESASEKSFKEFTEILTNGRLASEIYHNAKKIYPLNRVEIIKSKVFN
ncbi:30S ribosomal protein S3ae [Methanobrevibacter sp. 87.7]|uniref:30S ribosomal protein S3ae n=1 Tax=Methanobrevibacter sp. 87.7 TaxID=387957 RepID=UPI000B50B87A|nr:30S ribosomal protein S3ae [Methanobrevibacter sp. 87.7]OWT33314.1 30S ribosomal protein S3ae [Methanobrevibacter sp. 87.7]